MVSIYFFPSLWHQDLNCSQNKKRNHGITSIVSTISFLYRFWRVNHDRYAILQVLHGSSNFNQYCCQIHCVNFSVHHKVIYSDWTTKLDFFHKRYIIALYFRCMLLELQKHSGPNSIVSMPRIRPKKTRPYGNISIRKILRCWIKLAQILFYALIKYVHILIFILM